MREISIFVSSPGDLAVERQIARLVIERLAHRFKERAALKPCFWEHIPIHAHASIQGQLPKPSEFDVMVMMLWSRIGTRLEEEMRRPDGTRYDSGTEFEFEDAMAGRRGPGIPRLLVYEKKDDFLLNGDMSEEDLMDAKRQRTMVRKFIDRWFMNADGTWHKGFRTFDSPAQFEEQLEEHLRRLLEEVLSNSVKPDERFIPRVNEWDPDHHGSPFRGLSQFDVKDRAIYFGRTNAIYELLDILRKAAVRSYPFVLVFGKSGVGKSSFLRAGVLPVLREPGMIEGYRTWRYAIFEPAKSPRDLLEGLAAALLGETALPGLARAANEKEFSSLLRNSPESVVALVRQELVARAAALPNDPSNDKPQAMGLALLIDPVEEIFTRTGSTPEAHDERELFIKAVAMLARSKLVWVLGSIRSDFYEDCAAHQLLLERLTGDGYYNLAPPTPVETGRMIRLPAEKAGLEFEEHENLGKLDEVLLREASGDPDALPLLEFTLEEFYKLSRAAKTNHLTFKFYDQLGGLHGAVRTRADEEWAKVAEQLGSRLDAAIDNVFSAVVGFRADSARVPVRRRAPLAPLKSNPDCKVLVDAFVKARLLTTSADDVKHPEITLGHETLLKNWPRLKEWIEKNQDFLQSRNRITTAAARWQEEGRDVAYLLLEGKPLAEGRDLLSNRRQKLNPAQIEFLEKSIQHADERKRLAARRARIIFTSVSILAVLASILAVFSIFNARQAAQEARNAEDSRETAEYRRIIATNSFSKISEERDEAEARADESEDLAQFLIQDIGAHLQPSSSQTRSLIAKIAERTRTHYEKVKLNDESDTAMIEQSQARFKVASTMEQMGRFSDAIALCDQISDILRQLQNGNPGIPSDVLLLAGRCENQIGLYHEAESSFQQALLTSTNVDAVKVELGNLYRFTGRYSESERQLAIPVGKNASLKHLLALGELMRYENRLPEAENRFTEALQMAQQTVKQLNGQRDEIKKRLQSSPDGQKQALDAQLGDLQDKIEKADNDLAKAESDLGVLRYDQSNIGEAFDLLNSALEYDLGAKGEEHPLVAVDQYKLARVMIKLRQLQKADEMLAKCEKTLAVDIGNNVNQRMAKCLETVADLRSAQGRYDEAEAAARDVLSIRLHIFTDWAPHPEIWKAYQEIADICQAKNKKAEAEHDRALAAEMRAAHIRRETAAGASCAGEL